MSREIRGFLWLLIAGTVTSRRRHSRPRIDWSLASQPIASRLLRAMTNSIVRRRNRPFSLGRFVKRFSSSFFSYGLPVVKFGAVPGALAFMYFFTEPTPS